MPVPYNPLHPKPIRTPNTNPQNFTSQPLHMKMTYAMGGLQERGSIIDHCPITLQPQPQPPTPTSKSLQNIHVKTLSTWR